MKDKVWAFEYCDCVYESTFSTMSLHRTAKGAYRAMRDFILKEYESWRDSGLKYGKQRFKHGFAEDWRVVSVEINE